MSPCHKYGISPDPMTMPAIIGCMLVLGRMLSYSGKGMAGEGGGHKL